jgi:2-(1,2-epoxy-1,2-dihydrophenyl)acetyl-CoA isomerase
MSATAGEGAHAGKAREFGLVNWVVPRDGLAGATMAMARRLADGPTLALGRAKRLIRSSLDNSWDEQSHRERRSRRWCGPRTTRRGWPRSWRSARRGSGDGEAA